MNKLLVFIFIFYIGSQALSQKSSLKYSAEVISNNSTHVARITKDSIIVITGSTYSFTVDAPEDSGLVSTNTTVHQLLSQIKAKDGTVQQYSIIDKNGSIKTEGRLINGDKLNVDSKDGKVKKTYGIAVQPMALNGHLWLDKKDLTVQTNSNLTLYFTVGQRTPDATVKIYIPRGITITQENTTINIIGRGAVKLKDLPTQSIGRVGSYYSYSKVGEYEIKKITDGGSLLLLKHLDLRPANGTDIVITISNVNFILAGKHIFKASYTTSKPEMLNSVEATATLTINRTIADLERVVDKNLQYKETPDTYTKASFKWSATEKTSVIELWRSTNKGKSWSYVPAVIDPKKGIASISNLQLHKLYHFRLKVKDGSHSGYSNIVQFYSGKMDIKSFDVIADGNTDNTDKINEAIGYLNQIGGGTLLFSNGIYDPAKDEPYYIKKDGSKDFDTDNMLKIDRAGHFALLATGTDNINVHNTYFAKYNESNARDIYDFMACNNVTVTNIYSKVSSDDIVKPGSDCSLGFTRPARNYKVRNVIGDTNCNLFQIGSETADDIMDIHVDNIYVLGANKAGFSISTNDGGHIKDIHLNCGHTGTLHSRSKMLRTYAPFFISISNRGRILGASVTRYKFYDDTVKHDELLVTNVNIGMVENIVINGIDITEVYAGSSYGDKTKRWDVYDSQRKTTSIIAGYSLPGSKNIEGGLKFTLPNGLHTGYIKNISFNDVNILYKGGNPVSDTARTPGELGVGQYNASNLGILPSYGLWARHVTGLSLKRCNFSYEKPDGRYPIFLDDVIGAEIIDTKMMKGKDNNMQVKLKNSTKISVEDVRY